MVVLPPRVTAGARWIAVAATITTAATTSIGTASRRCVATLRSSAVTTSVAALRSTAPAAAAAAEATTSTHATNVTGSSIATATTSTTAATTAAKARALTGNALKEARNLLVGLLQKLEEVSDNTTVATVEECCRNTGVSGTTGTTDTMNIVVDVSRQVVVDHVSHIRDVCKFISMRKQ
jgi:hypothetical protein